MRQAYSYAVRADTLSPNDNDECFVWFVPGSIAPILLGAIEIFIQREAWSNDAEWIQSRNRLLSVMKGAYMLCVADLIQEIRDLRGVRADREAIPPEERTSDDYVSIRNLIDLSTAAAPNYPYIRANYNLLRNLLTGEATNAVEFTEETARTPIVGIQQSTLAAANALYETAGFLPEEAIPIKINSALRDGSGSSTAYDRLESIESAVYTGSAGNSDSAASLLASLLGILA